MITGIFYGFLLLNLFQTMFDGVRNRATMIFIGNGNKTPTEFTLFFQIFPPIDAH